MLRMYGILITIGLLVSACGDDGTLETHPGAELGALLVAPNGVGFDGRTAWFISSVRRADPDAVDRVGSDEQVFDAPHRVLRGEFDSTGRLMLAADGSSVPAMPRMTVGDVLAADGRLYVAGEECVGGGIAEACIAQSVVRMFDGTEWHTTVTTAPSDREIGSLASHFLPVGNPDTIELELAVDEEGIFAGESRIVSYDKRTLKRVDVSPPLPGTVCMVDGRYFSLKFDGGFLAPESQMADSPFVGVPTTYEVLELVSDRWVSVMNGRFEGKRPAAESINCGNFGYSTAVVGFDVTYLGWTPGRGWFEGTPSDRVASADPGFPGSTSASGQGGLTLVGIEGETYIEVAPGEFERSAAFDADWPKPNYFYVANDALMVCFPHTPDDLVLDRCELAVTSIQPTDHGR